MTIFIMLYNQLFLFYHYSLDAFESPRNPLRNDCHEREWTGDYIIPLIQGALKLDGKFRVPW